MKKKFSSYKNQKGQFVIEAVLLMALSLGLFVAGTRYLREKKVIETAVQGPWAHVASMSESGVWNPKFKSSNPNAAYKRGVTLNDFNSK